MKAPAEDRFMNKVWIVESGCWLWTGAVTSAGYANFINEIGRNTLGHRWAFERYVHRIPEGMVIDHACHTTSCVNPDHLRVATFGENASNRSGIHPQSISGKRNVNWDGTAKKWVVRVKLFGKFYYGGFFEDADLAADAAAKLRDSLYGEFAGTD